MKVGDQVRIKTNGLDGTIIGDFTEADGTVHYKVKYFVPNSRGYGYLEEYGSFFFGHELEGETKMEKFDVSGEGIDKHEIGNSDCKNGWCGCHGWPHRCKCGGLIHADFGDENYDGDYWLYRMCDKCGEDWEFEEGGR